MSKSKGHTQQCAQWLQKELAKKLNMHIEDLQGLKPKFVEQFIISDSDYASDTENGVIKVVDTLYSYFYFHNEKGSYITEY